MIGAHHVCQHQKQRHAKNRKLQAQSHQSLSVCPFQMLCCMCGILPVLTDRQMEWFCHGPDHCSDTLHCSENRDCCCMVYQHGLQHVICILTRGTTDMNHLFLEGTRHYLRVTYFLLVTGTSQQAIQKMFVLTACDCLFMSCTMSEGVPSGLRLHT